MHITCLATRINVARKGLSMDCSIQFISTIFSLSSAFFFPLSIKMVLDDSPNCCHGNYCPPSSLTNSFPKRWGELERIFSTVLQNKAAQRDYLWHFYNCHFLHAFGQWLLQLANPHRAKCQCMPSINVRRDPVCSSHCYLNLLVNEKE